MLKSTFSTFLLLSTVLLHAQAKPKATDSLLVKKDSVKPKTERYGLRLGIDALKLSRGFYDSNYRGLELVGDFKLTRKHYLAAELGNENSTVDDAQLNFTTKGSYIKAGFDYNGYENWRGMHNMLYVGMRLGVSTFSQTLNSYSIYYAHTYFPKPTITSGEQFNGLTAQWIEVVAGVKTEILPNVYLGMSVRLNNLIANKKPDNFDNLYIPGFNRTHGGNFGASFNYTISYFIPLYKGSK